MEASRVKASAAQTMAAMPRDIAAGAVVERVGHTEREIAQALGVSVGWIKKDRLTKRLIPYWKIGRTVRYDLARVREALARLQVGGAQETKRKRAEKVAA